MTRLRVDLDLVEQTGRGTRFLRALAGLVGSIAVLASILALIQVSASQQGARSNLMAARLAAAASERIEASGLYTTFIGVSGQQALVLAIDASSRGLAALTEGDPTGAEEAKSAADSAAADRLQAIVPRMAPAPHEGGPLDAHTVEVLNASIESLQAMVADQNAQREDARLWSGRSASAILGLTLLALAGVLAGLAGLLGEGRAGLIALGTAAAATGLAALAGIVAVVR